MTPADELFNIAAVDDKDQKMVIMNQALLLILEHENQGVVCGNINGDRFVLYRNTEDRLDIAPADENDWYGKIVFVNRGI